MKALRVERLGSNPNCRKSRTAPAKDKPLGLNAKALSEILDLNKNSAAQ
jgi:hypothetical protein